nr:MAG TPA: hypothetical protein [Bacteriophage sp.]
MAVTCRDLPTISCPTSCGAMRRNISRKVTPIQILL